MAIATINPTNGKTLRTFEELSDAEIGRKLNLAQAAFSDYRRTNFADRAERMRRAAGMLEAEAERWGELMATEMGKTKKSAVAEAQKCAWACRHYADHAQKYLADENVQLTDARGLVRCLPLGPVLAIMPWNFPFWQVFRFAAPALMAGNVGLLKHASNVPQCALAIEEIFLKAGFPTGVFQTLLIGSGKVGPLIADPRVVAVTLTGSEGAGSEVASAAGKHIKKSVLELGGSDPFIVMPSADLEAAARVGVAARTINNGQSCIAAKRFIIHRDIYQQFEEKFVRGMRSLRVGDPMEENTDVGPLSSKAGLDALDEQVKDAVAKGARLWVGGKRVSGPGNFYEPTALADLPKTARVYREEVFGPVALLFKANGIDEAISIANDTSFGLGSSVWTRDSAERERFINEIQAGLTFFNSMVASDPRLPFGGVKRSGYGRELGREGIREFMNIKTVQIQEDRTERKSQTE
jgi:succinate-semialdehyde dehydrogenase/glutarate-semialdehyde dehydrogenase